MHNVFWEVFTREEHDVLNKLIAMGERDNLAQGVVEMTPAKEAELQKIADHMRPVSTEFESEEAKKYVAERMKNGLEPSPQSPEEERALQARLDAEMKAEQDKQRAQSVERQAKLSKTTVVEHIAEEVKEELKKVFCEFCTSKGVKHLNSCTRPVAEVTK